MRCKAELVAGLERRGGTLVNINPSDANCLLQLLQQLLPQLRATGRLPAVARGAEDGRALGAGRVDCSLYANFVASVVAAVAAVAAVADVAATANNYSNIVAAGAAAVAAASLCVLNGNCSGG